jgi:hypothetical protein
MKLTIRDLSISKELDRKAMSVVRGGQGDQANANQQFAMNASAVKHLVGNDSVFLGPTTIQADTHVDQYSDNYADNYNYKAFGLPVVPA